MHFVIYKLDFSVFVDEHRCVMGTLCAFCQCSDEYADSMRFRGMADRLESIAGE